MAQKLKKYPSKEGWKKYNERLVQRGELYLNLSFVKTWSEELECMNEGKRGSPYEYPDSLMQFCAVFYHFFHLPYRQLEGVLRGLSRFIPDLKAPDYSTPNRRFSKLEIDLPSRDPHKPLIIAVDSSGIKVTNRGEWMRLKHKGERKGWIKVHIVVDVESKELLAVEVTDECVGDSKMFKSLLEKIENIEDVLADGAYDTNDNFNYMDGRGVGPPGIKVRANAVIDDESPARAEAVKERKKLGYKKWKEEHGYGRRWASEGVFSCVKRVFGESVRATTVEGMMQEVKMKFLLYNLLLSI